MVQRFVLEQIICFTNKIYAKGYGLSELRSMQHEYHQNLLMPYWTNPKQTTKNRRLKQCNWHFKHLNVIRVFESNSYRLHYGFGFSLEDNLGHFICDISRGEKIIIKTGIPNIIHIVYTCEYIHVMSVCMNTQQWSSFTWRKPRNLSTIYFLFKVYWSITYS